MCRIDLATPITNVLIHGTPLFLKCSLLDLYGDYRLYLYKILQAILIFFLQALLTLFCRSPYRPIVHTKTNEGKTE